MCSSISKSYTHILEKKEWIFPNILEQHSHQKLLHQPHCLFNNYSLQPNKSGFESSFVQNKCSFLHGKINRFNSNVRFTSNFIILFCGILTARCFGNPKKNYVVFSGLLENFSIMKNKRNYHYFNQVGVRTIQQQKHPVWVNKKNVLLHYNTRAYLAKMMAMKIIELDGKNMSQPTYIKKRALTDFHLFFNLGNNMRNK